MKRLLAIALFLIASSAAAQGGLSVNENTGDLTYTYAFELPKARGRHQPSLALHYSSASRANRGYGYGWNLTEWYVEKETRVAPKSSTGVYPNSHPVDPDVYVLVRGQQRDVIRFDGAAWVAMIQREPMTIEQSVSAYPPSSHWEITDAVGTRFVFAKVEVGGEDHRACGERWYLSSVVDLNGNRTDYRWDCTDGLTEILFNLSRNTSTPADSDFANRVLLERYQNVPSGTENAAGMVTIHDKRLAKVVVQGPTRATLRAYRLGYSDDPPTGGPPPPELLDPMASISSIRELGIGENGDLPATTFSYELARDLALGDAVPVPGPWDPWSWPLLNGPEEFDWTDLNGDGVADLKVGSYFAPGVGASGAWWISTRSATSCSSRTARSGKDPRAARTSISMATGWSTT